MVSDRGDGEPEAIPAGSAGNRGDPAPERRSSGSKPRIGIL